MDSYLSTIDNYIQEEDEKFRQQQLFHNQQGQLPQQQPHQGELDSSWSTSFTTNPYMQSVMNIPQQPMYTYDMTDYQHQSSMAPSLPPVNPQSTSDLHLTPPKIRKKPGRRPKPTSPAHRKEQNRAAQRAFRERKEHRLLTLQTELQALQKQHHSTDNKLKTTIHQLDESKTENCYLRGVILTLQFLLFQHSIGIPPHSPYLSEETLAEMSKTHPRSVKAYVKAYTQNNNCQKLDPNSHLSDQSNNSSSSPISSSSPSAPPDEKLDTSKPTNETHTEHHQSQSSIPSPGSLGNQDDIQDNNTNDNGTTSNTSAIQQIRLQLRIQSTAPTTCNPYQPSKRLELTPLQRTIDHDPRIDLIPCPKMRDRMIIFRHQMDYDHCFNMLLDASTYLGGDPSICSSWQVAPLFYNEYWFLCSNYDLASANGWQQTKHLPSTFPSNYPETLTTITTSPPPPGTAWSDDDHSSSVFASSSSIYGMEHQQQANHQLFGTSSSESLSALSHLRL